MTTMARNARPCATPIRVLFALGLGLLLFLFSAVPSHAQNDVPPLNVPPTMRAIDDVGVDRASGDYIPASMTITIGGENSGLDRTLSTAGLLDWGNFQESHDGRITILWSRTTGEDPQDYATGTSVSYEGKTELFDVILTEYINDGSNQCATSCNFGTGYSGSNLTCTNTSCRLTEKDGTLVDFIVPEAAQWDPNLSNSIIFGRISKVTKPDGEILDFTYYVKTGSDSLHPIRFLRAVRSSLGWMIKYDDNSKTSINYIAYRAWAFNLADDYCDINADTCTLTRTWPTAEVVGIGSIPPVITLRKNGLDQFTFSRNPNGPTYGWNSAAGSHLGRIVTGSGITTDLTFWDQSVAKNCVFNPPPGVIINCGPWYKDGRIATVKKGSSTWNYDYDDPGAPGWGGTPNRVNRTDPLGGFTKINVEAGVLNPIVYWVDNELGKRTNFQSDDQGYPIRITYPEGDYVSVTYDARHNVTERREVAKPGSGLPDRVMSAYYDSTCTNMMACGKALWTRDANANTPANINNAALRTDYVYNPVHGGVTSVTGPANASGLRKQTRFYYAQFYPQLKNASGVLVASTPVWRLTRKETCASSTNSCSGTGDEQVELYEYSQNNLLLTASTVKTGDNATVARTEYAYDELGDVISIDGPRQDVDDKSYIVWDSFRRPIFEIGPDPDGAGPRKRSIVKYTYDADGQETLRQNGTGTTIAFTAGVPTDVSDFVVTSSKASSYDPATGRLVKVTVSAP